VLLDLGRRPSFEDGLQDDRRVQIEGAGHGSGHVPLRSKLI
jgi:hypothetical protein